MVGNTDVGKVPNVTFEAFRSDKADPLPAKVRTPVVTYIGEATVDRGGQPHPRPFPMESCIYYLLLKNKRQILQ